MTRSGRFWQVFAGYCRLREEGIASASRSWLASLALQVRPAVVKTEINVLCCKLGVFGIAPKLAVDDVGGRLAVDLSLRSLTERLGFLMHPFPPSDKLRTVRPRPVAPELYWALGFLVQALDATPLIHGLLELPADRVRPSQDFGD